MKRLDVLLIGVFSFIAVAATAMNAVGKSNDSPTTDDQTNICKHPLPNQVSLDLGNYQGIFTVFPDQGGAPSGTGKVFQCSQTDMCRCAISETTDLSGTWAIRFSGWDAAPNTPDLLVNLTQNRIVSVAGNLDHEFYDYDSLNIKLSEKAFQKVTFARSNFAGSWNLEYWIPTVSPKGDPHKELKIQLIRGVKFAITALSADESLSCRTTFLLSKNGKIAEVAADSFIAIDPEKEAELIISEPNCPK